MRKAALALALAAALAPAAGTAAAHPFTDATVPEQFSSAPAGTAEVIVFYSEGVEIGFSELKVLDSSGEQVDNRDTAYHEGDSSLAVTTPPLEDGVYTVTSRVLSRVDGHLVDYAFVFGVGGAVVDREAAAGAPQSELIFLPEAGARFPGLVGQTVVLGALIASMLVLGARWRAHAGAEEGRLGGLLHGRLVSLAGVGLVLVLASNMLVLVVQVLRLEAPVPDVLQTSFGATWSARMGLTAALIAAWFAAERAGRASPRALAPLLALSLALIATTTMVGHGAASGQPAAVAMDYMHNLVAAAWIGGVAFFAFALLPALRELGGAAGERLALAAIPRFSALAVASLGAVAATGPLLLWMLEPDLGTAAASTYGRIIAAKVAIGAGMVALGAYHQFAVQGRAGARGGPVIARLRRPLRAEAALGVALLGAVALLVNGTLPGGEVQAAGPAEAPRGLHVDEYTGQARLGISVYPLAPGANAVEVEAADPGGGPLEGLEGVRVKVSNPARGIAPIAVPMERTGDGAFRGEATFGFSGVWQLEVEAQRSSGGNEGAALMLPVRPALGDLGVSVVEHALPGGAPLYPVYDGAGSIWVSDASAPRVWRFSVADGTFEEYPFEGRASIALALDGAGRVWFTDTPGGRIGYVDPATGGAETFGLPVIGGSAGGGVPVTLDVDAAGGVWVAVTNKNALARYDPGSGSYDVHALPTPDSAPFAVAVAGDGAVWFTQQAAGQIGRLDPATGRIEEIAAEPPLRAPETITFGPRGGLWISEHAEGGGIARYDPALGTFERVPATDAAALPNSVAFGRHGNAWYAMHTVDKVGAHDPATGESAEFPLPTAGSWVQFTAVDGEGRVWLAEQRPARLAVLEVSEPPPAASAPGPPREGGAGPAYALVAGPLMAAGIVASALFFARAVTDRRRIDALPPP